MKYKPSSVIIFVTIALIIIVGIVLSAKKNVTAPVVEQQPTTSPSPSPSPTYTPPVQ